MNGDSDDKMDEIELENTGAIRVIITGPDGYDNPSFNNDKNDESGKGDNSSRRGSRFSAIDVHGTILSDLGSSEEKEKRVNFDDERDEALHLITTSSAPPKDFNLEVRASLDIKHYLKDMTISLDLQSDDLYNLVHHLVNQMKEETKAKLDLDEIMGSIFCEKESRVIINRIQGVLESNSSPTVFDQSWVCILGSGVSVKKHMIALGITEAPLNLGHGMEQIRFILIILTPTIEKHTKSSYEIGRTFSTLLMHHSLRFDLLDSSKESIKEILTDKAAELSTKSNQVKRKVIHGLDTSLWENISRRVRCYHTDFVDGIVGKKTIHKTLATSLFLYFGCILPAIAFGLLNSKNTNGLIGPKRALVGQALGGIVFALIGGQPLVIIATTALVSLYIKVVYEISEQLDVDFFVMYATVGFWNTLFVLAYAVFGWSKLIKYATRSVEEIFAQFITICFFYDAINDCVESFNKYYHTEACANFTKLTDGELNVTTLETPIICQREDSLLHLLLALGTVWLSLRIYKFNQSPYLSRGMREFVSDYALPIGVIGLSVVSKVVFADIKLEQFDFSVMDKFERATIDFSSVKVIGISIVLGFALSLLFFMDQNITGQIVNGPTNHLKKGSAPHLDLLVIAIINCTLSFYGLPWMHGILPHSPLHVRSLADTEERNNQGLIETHIIRVRETRITALLSNILIGLSLFMIPYPLNLISTPVLDGLFLYCAFASLRGSSMFQRICLLFQEQSSYPPNHYVRRARQRIIHLFTLCEIIQLVILVYVGLIAPWAYLRMAFPVFIALLMPIRHFILPIFLDKKTLKLLDSYG